MQPSEARYYYQLSRALTVTKDIPNAVAALKEAADLKYPSAMLRQYAVDMRDRIGMTRNSARAVGLMKKAAAAGSGDAMASLAVLYSRGGGVPRDDKVAFGWNQRGADANNPVALNNLAAMYRDDHAKKIPTKATELFEGHRAGKPSAACFNLAWMLNGEQAWPTIPGDGSAVYRAAARPRPLRCAAPPAGSTSTPTRSRQCRRCCSSTATMSGPIGNGNFGSDHRYLANSIGTAESNGKLLLPAVTCSGCGSVTRTVA